ncbi:hypothetical protein CR513_38168, partial [Mucuna pruriens]
MIQRTLDDMQMRGNMMDNFDMLFMDFDNEPRNLRIGLVIDGMNSYCNLIYVYLSPLAEDLRILWDKGVDISVTLLCTINDFLAYGNLSGYSAKGHKACPTVEKAQPTIN